MKLPVIFWGSSELSVPFLELLYNDENVEITDVITLPSKPKGRGLILQPTVVNVFAQKLGLNIFCPKDVNSQDFIDILRTKKPQLSIVVSFGKIFRKEIMDLHKIGMLNVHFSLLPKYRGAAPIQWSLINGEKVTGVTIFWIEEKMDAGKIFLQKEVNIENNDNYYTLSEKLVKLGCEMLKNCLRRVLDNDIVKYDQVGQASFAPEINKSMSIIDWRKSSEEIHNLVRGIVKWPKAVSKLKIKDKIVVLKLLNTEVLEKKYEFLYDCGSIIKVLSDSLIVKCGLGTLLKIITIQPENKKVMSVREFLCGHKIVPGEKFF